LTTELDSMLNNLEPTWVQEFTTQFDIV